MHPSEPRASQTVYVFVRKDLPIADQIVQVGHACIEAATRFTVPRNCRLVLLEVADHVALEHALDYCSNRRIATAAFYEPDPMGDGLMEPMGVTAACTE